MRKPNDHASARWPGGVDARGEPILNDANTKAVADRRAARQKAKPVQDTAASHLRNALQIILTARELGEPLTNQNAATIERRIYAALAILEGKKI